LSGGDHAIRLESVDVGLVPSWEYAVLYVQRRVHIFASGTGARLQKALLKVVAQKSV